MAGNSFGNLFRITTFGESHGPAIGVVIDGCPSNFAIDLEAIQLQLNRRRPGQSAVTSARKEDDTFEVLSGLFEGKTTGAPLAFLIRNKDARSKDYDSLKDVYRPSHADQTYDLKYGHRDYRGGGRSSARETAMRVLAGSVAQQILSSIGIKITAYVSQVGEIMLNKNYNQLDLSKIENNIVRCPDEIIAGQMEAYIAEVKKDGDTCGGVITCVAQQVPAGLGEPVFNKLHADLGKAMLSINAVHGFEFGSGFGAAMMKGSEHNSPLTHRQVGAGSEGGMIADSNLQPHSSGGILGGISNGMDIYFRVAFKPVATIMKPQQTINKAGEIVTLEPRGRHDACVVPRAVPIVEAMTALVLIDHYLLNKAVQL